MIDLVNFVVAVAAAIALGFVLCRCRCRLRTVAVAVSAFIIGMAFHSIMLHEKIRHGWKFPWNHYKKEPNMVEFVKKVEIEDLRRGDLIIVRWRDASDTRGFIEDFGEPQWCKDWGFYLGIVGRIHRQLLISKDVAEGHAAWGVSRIPLELIDEILLWIPCEKAKQVVPELRFKGRRIRTRRYERESLREDLRYD